ncbi:outer membrane exchange protein TraB [Myxococcus sp. K15C18031901]|uniref:outer membrane exchange protein TraB n=1 Tax=Myxococcus dinghuensis TaxID=2906761 RepID=UPI0020A756D1|nr:outer membrane exchange protein TraB [Myxococcus dinghuensis]MCP3099692.1 outer membrane exchange protein TraB [Myxococcus dinghuensis]
MKTSRLPLLLAALGWSTLAAAQPDARFDVQLFRPSAGPQDLVVVTQSRPLSHATVAAGPYFSYSLNPLTLIPEGGDLEKISLVGNRLQLDVMAMVGLFDWAEVGVDMPLILAQGGQNLEVIGTEGSVESFVLGDLRISGKVAIPGLRRPAEGKGFGAALTLNVSFPTGAQDAFAGEGELTWAPGLVVDYRFGNGILLALNGGFWKRPDRVFDDVQLGDMMPFGVGAEVPILRGSGVMALGMVNGAVGLKKAPGQERQVPAELLIGLRWYSSTGLTFTFGGGAGCGCSLASPTLSFFTSIIWIPAKTREWEALERFKEPPEPPPPPAPLIDPDGDSVIGVTDRCPDVPGPVENAGCPDFDRDGDGVVDRLDKCPDQPANSRGREGCPLARRDGNKIVILEQVNFATDQDVILSESFPILEEVARVMNENKEVDRILVEGHTDARASDAYNLELSRRRASSVMRFLVESGVVAERLCSQGFGRSRPLSDNTTEEGMALNRRVEFTIQPPSEGPRPPCPEEPTDKKGKRPKPQKAPVSRPNTGSPAPTP